jgi:UDP-N-acetylmuramyl tripeptide synthase
LFIPGRFEEIKLGQNYRIIIDFAHTPNAVNNILDYANSVKKNRIISISGAAGGRWKEKRPIIGKALIQKSDYVIFTYDDPRTEDVNEIINQMLLNVENNKEKYERITDRTEAIKRAIEIAQKDDIILILGRGNETTVPINGELIHQNDLEDVKKVIKGE